MISWRTVNNGDALEAGAEELKAGAGCGVEAMQLHARAGGVAIFRAEGVLEDTLQGVRGGRVGEDRNAVGEPEAEGAEVIKAEDVIRVTVRVENGVDPAKILAECLGVEVRSGVDEDNVVVVLEAQRGPGATIAWVA